MSDLISRQAAINALLELVEARRTWTSTEDARKEISGIDASMCAIHDLPSVQPEIIACGSGELKEQPEADEWCFDCPAYDNEKHNCPRFNKVIRKTVEEIQENKVSEHSAWFRISETLVNESKGDITAEQAVDKIRDYLKRMEKPERKKGKWITNKYGAVVCSECNWNAPRIMTGCLVNRHLDYDKSDYCWHCGADMRGEQE